MTSVPPYATLVRGRRRKRVEFEARIKELVEDVPDLAVLVEPLLSGGCFASRSASCIAVCWPSSG